jgi:hypothetical protein
MDILTEAKKIIEECAIVERYIDYHMPNRVSIPTEEEIRQRKRIHGIVEELNKKWAERNKGE